MLPRDRAFPNEMMMMMNPTSHTRRVLPNMLLVGIAMLLGFPSGAVAQQDVRIFLDSTAQVIRGFGAANIVGWRPDMTDAEIETAFGEGEGRLGFSILRLRIPPQESQWNINVRTARMAHALGVKLIASPWSPPAGMKTNNNVVGGRLREDMYDDYAEHLDSFSTFMAANDAPVYAVSIQNEPDIQVEYESCDWSRAEMWRFMKDNAASIDARIIAPESFQFRHEMSDLLLNDPTASGNLDIVGGHIYGGGLAPYPLAEEKGKEVWMTEHLVLDTSLEANIGTAVEIQDVMKAGMSAYIWWYIVRYYGPISDGESGEYGKGEITKRGYVMSQFSRFIRPGFVRVHTGGSAGSSDVSITAYRDSSNVVVVAVNDASVPREVTLALDGGSVGLLRRYVTSETQDVQKLDDVEASENRFTVTLGGNSVTTFVSDFTTVANEDVAEPAASSRLSQNYPNPFSSATAIEYAVARTSDVTLEVFDVLGRKVATLVNRPVSAGSHRATFNASGLPAGTYLYRLETNEAVQTRRMTLLNR